MSGTGNGSRHCGCVAQNFRKAESGPFQTITLKEGEKQTTDDSKKRLHHLLACSTRAKRKRDFLFKISVWHTLSHKFIPKSFAHCSKPTILSRNFECKKSGIFTFLIFFPNFFFLFFDILFYNYFSIILIFLYFHVFFFNVLIFLFVFFLVKIDFFFCVWKV